MASAAAPCDGSLLGCRCSRDSATPLRLEASRRSSGTGEHYDRGTMSWFGARMIICIGTALAFRRAGFPHLPEAYAARNLAGEGSGRKPPPSPRKSIASCMRRTLLITGRGTIQQCSRLPEPVWLRSPFERPRPSNRSSLSRRGLAAPTGYRSVARRRAWREGAAA